jgi:lipopolysaccharide export system protein LptA
MNKAVAKSYQSFVRRLVANLCEDALDKKKEEAENIRLQLRKF